MVWTSRHGAPEDNNILFGDGANERPPASARWPKHIGAWQKKSACSPFHNKNDAQFLYQLDRERHSENVRTQE